VLSSLGALLRWPLPDTGLEPTDRPSVECRV